MRKNYNRASKPFKPLNLDQRYDKIEFALNISNLSQIDFNNLSSVIYLSRSILYNKYKVRTLDISSNSIRSLSFFKELIRSLPHLEHISIANNEIADIFEIKNLLIYKDSLRELLINNNPLKNKTKEDIYRFYIKKMFPSLKSLDGISFLDNKFSSVFSISSHTVLGSEDHKGINYNGYMEKDNSQSYIRTKSEMNERYPIRTENNILRTSNKSGNQAEENLSGKDLFNSNKVDLLKIPFPIYSRVSFVSSPLFNESISKENTQIPGNPNDSNRVIINEQNKAEENKNWVFELCCQFVKRFNELLELQQSETLSAVYSPSSKLKVQFGRNKEVKKTGREEIISWWKKAENIKHIESSFNINVQSITEKLYIIKYSGYFRSKNKSNSLKQVIRNLVVEIEKHESKIEIKNDILLLSDVEFKKIGNTDNFNKNRIGGRIDTNEIESFLQELESDNREKEMKENLRIKKFEETRNIYVEKFNIPINQVAKVISVYGDDFYRFECSTR